MIPLARVLEIESTYYGKRRRESPGPQLLAEMLELRRFAAS